MQVIQVQEYGGPERLELVDVPDPTPGAGELLVTVAAAGVNFRDVYERTGIYPRPTPLRVGLEGAGTVTAVGSGVTEFTVGDRVAWSNAPSSYATQVIVPEDEALPVPEGVSDEVAAALPLQGMTAHYLIVSTYPVRADESVLVHAAAGGVGLLLTQMAKARGARVIGTVSTEEKAELARAAGADEVILYSDPAYAEPAALANRVRELSDGGVHVVYDGVGRATFDASLASLRRRGYLVLYGGSSGQVPPFDPQRLNAGGSLFLTRPTLGHYTADKDELRWRASEVFTEAAVGRLDVRIGARFPLAQAADAHIALEERRTTGKVLLIP